MGNCLRRAPVGQCGGEDDDFSTPVRRDRDPSFRRKTEKVKEEDIVGDKGRGLSSCSAAASTEVKIKITKKQLEELLKKADVKELTAEQIVAQLMNVSDRFEAHQRAWRPALQSIPEVN